MLISDRLRTQSLVLLGFFYLLIIVVFSQDYLAYDEPRYYDGAHCITKGYFASDDRPDIANGPGYPLLLAPVVSILDFEDSRIAVGSAQYDFFIPDASGQPIQNLKWRLFPLRALNALFLIAGVFVAYKTARLIVSSQSAMILATVIALNPQQLKWLPYLASENITPLLFGLFAYFYIKGLQSGQFSIKYTLLAGLAFCALALTRSLFGYVALAALFVTPVFMLLDQNRTQLTKATLPFAFALLFCAPYLAYTQHYTGKFFHWSTVGPELIYWITSPHEKETGSWMFEQWVYDDPELSANHGQFLKEVAATPLKDREAKWSEGVMHNLQHPNIVKALVRNYTANLSRVFTNAPRTHTRGGLSKIFWILNGLIFLAAILLALIPTVARWRSIRVEVKALLVVSSIYFGGVIMLPAEPRYLIPILPALYLWMAHVFELRGKRK
ncbi:MAG: glycosyltransferase family 39 protein [Granulosicoccus sp.]